MIQISGGTKVITSRDFLSAAQIEVQRHEEGEWDFIAVLATTGDFAYFFQLVPEREPELLGLLPQDAKVKDKPAEMVKPKSRRKPSKK